jgi:hypothetical protein
LAREENALNDYVFERRIDFKHPDGTTTSGFIDCYLKHSFVLEAKQSRKRQKVKPTADQLMLLPEDAQQFKSGRLAKIAKRLEGSHDAKDVAEFLMRCLFTMFAEGTKLIPNKGFHRLLGQMKDTPEHFVAALESLWAVMDQGGYPDFSIRTTSVYRNEKRSANEAERSMFAAVR